jgi:hypothetical protein
MPWMRISVGKADHDGGLRLQAEFMAFFVAAGGPRDAVMYAGMRSRNRGNYYFTPRAASIGSDLMLRYNAVTCAEPDLRAVSIRVSAQ